MQAAATSELTSFKQVKLRDIDISVYEQYLDQLPERFRKRARHFLEENRRVQEGVSAWKEGNIRRFGELVFQSGESSIYNYECGCPELIAIYDILRNTTGVYGARFSGAGYRGCCIGLINPRDRENIRKKVTNEYLSKYPQMEDVFEINFCKTDNGARII